MCFATQLALAQTLLADTSAARTTYPWIDISTTGTQVPLADDAVSGAVPIGFTFNFAARYHDGAKSQATACCVLPAPAQRTSPTPCR